MCPSLMDSVTIELEAKSVIIVWVVTNKLKPSSMYKYSVKAKDKAKPF